MSIYEGDKRDCRKFCTTGIDGAMTIWDFKVPADTTHKMFGMLGMWMEFFRTFYR